VRRWRTGPGGTVAGSRIAGADRSPVAAANRCGAAAVAGSRAANRQHPDDRAQPSATAVAGSVAAADCCSTSTANRARCPVEPELYPKWNTIAWAANRSAGRAGI